MELNIDGKIYNAIKTLYSDNKAFVRVNNDTQTDWFDVPYGVRQGDPLSSTLSNININGLTEHLKQLDLGNEISNVLKICILLYADDLGFYHLELNQEDFIIFVILTQAKLIN